MLLSYAEMRDANLHGLGRGLDRLVGLILVHPSLAPSIEGRISPWLGRWPGRSGWADFVGPYSALEIKGYKLPRLGPWPKRSGWVVF